MRVQGRRVPAQCRRLRVDRGRVEHETGRLPAAVPDFDQSRPASASSTLANNGLAAAITTMPTTYCSRSAASDLTRAPAPSTMSGTAVSAAPSVTTEAAWSATNAAAIPASTAIASAFCVTI